MRNLASLASSVGTLSLEIEHQAARDRLEDVARRLKVAHLASRVAHLAGRRNPHAPEFPRPAILPSTHSVMKMYVHVLLYDDTS